ncbi:hypothetical protein ACFQT0_29420 [Hymenobacter humi]|uniref:Uncharacterized protein n=1 Tax=Hymenobacter humi TaxID=1411620 RepID=A0ABW2UE09_9BACT
MLAGAREVNDFSLARTGQLVVLSSQAQQPTEVYALSKKRRCGPYPSKTIRGCAALRSAPSSPSRPRARTARS